MFLKFSLFFSTLFFLITSQAKIVVITDIDDTIKKTNVKNWWHSVVNSLNEDNYYPGMPELYSAIQKNKDHPVKFYYVSNAVGFLVDHSYTDFLKKYFPKGSIYYRSHPLDSAHKYTAIRKILKSENPTMVIYFGDNSEADPYIYAQMKREFKIPSLQFIRILHKESEGGDKSKLFGDQQPFYTPMEISYGLYKSGLLSEADYFDFREYVARQLHTHFDYYFPKYFQCGYWQKIDKTYQIMNESKTQSYEKSYLKIANLCLESLFSAELLAAR